MNDTRDVELNAIGVLKRREIGAQILVPLIESLRGEFGREKVLQIVRETIVGIARDQGRQLVQISGELGTCRICVYGRHGDNVELRRVVAEETANESADEAFGRQGCPEGQSEGRPQCFHGRHRGEAERPVVGRPLTGLSFWKGFWTQHKPQESDSHIGDYSPLREGSVCPTQG